MTLTMVPVFKDPSDPRNAHEPRGRPGDYAVTFVLGRPGFSQTQERNVEFSDFLQGDSHLAITPPAFTPPTVQGATQIRIRAIKEGIQLTFDGFPNNRGYLGKVVSEPFGAQDFNDAITSAYHALIPSLSNWSAQLDIPLSVSQIDAVETATGARSARILTPQLEMPFAVAGEPKLGSEFLHLASLYREGLNSNSSVYRFLCLFKVLEGIQARRTRIAINAVMSGQRPTIVSRRLPEQAREFETWLAKVFGARKWDALVLEAMFPQEVRGKKLNYVIQNKLLPLRTRIAHAILDSGDVGISVDNMLNIQEVDRWLPLTRCIARRLLKDDFPEEFLPHLPE